MPIKSHKKQCFIDSVHRCHIALLSFAGFIALQFITSLFAKLRSSAFILCNYFIKKQDYSLKSVPSAGLFHLDDVFPRCGVVWAFSVPSYGFGEVSGFSFTFGHGVLLCTQHDSFFAFFPIDAVDDGIKAFVFLKGVGVEVGKVCLDSIGGTQFEQHYARPFIVESLAVDMTQHIDSRIYDDHGR